VIVRDEGNALLLITQPDHARLAETIVASMRTEPGLAGGAGPVVLLATREHDNGWAEVDAEPTIDPASGRPRDFMTGPAAVKHELWLRGITRVATMNPRAGALVAEHALTVYGYRGQDAGWQPFFASIAAMRDDLLRQLGIMPGGAREAFEAQYRCVQLGDAFSLHFCSGWTEPKQVLDYQVGMREDTLMISPDPFDGAAVPLHVPGRRIPARRYRDDADLRDAMTAAVPHVVVGQARGI